MKKNIHHQQQTLTMKHHILLPRQLIRPLMICPSVPNERPQKVINGKKSVTRIIESETFTVNMFKEMKVGN